MISFLVQGQPRGKGSWRPITAKGGRTFLVNSSKQAKAWEKLVKAAAKEAGARLKPNRSVEIAFYFERPKAHYRTGKFSHELRADVAPFPTKRWCGDVDKLARLVLDALSGIAYDDDQDVVELIVTKAWAGAEGALSTQGALITLDEIEVECGA